MIYTPNGQDVLPEIALSDGAFSRRYPPFHHEEQLPSMPPNPRTYFHELQAKALGTFNCIESRRHGERTRLDMGTFTDNAHWVFAELLQDMGWLTLTTVVRESK